MLQRTVASTEVSLQDSQPGDILARQAGACPSECFVGHWGKERQAVLLWGGLQGSGNRT